MDHDDFNGKVNKNCLVGDKRSESCLNTTSNEVFDSLLKSRSRVSSTESEVYEVVAEFDNDECENEIHGDAGHHINELNNINLNGNLNENPADDLNDSVEMDEEFVIVEDDGNDAVEEINNSQEQLPDSKQHTSLDNCNAEEIDEECPVPWENAQCLKDSAGSASEKLSASDSKQNTSNTLLSSENSELTDEFLKECKGKHSPAMSPLMMQSDEKTNLTDESDISKEGPDNVNVSEASLPPGGDSNSISTVGFEDQAFDDTGQNVKISIDNPTVKDYKVNCVSLHKNNKNNISDGFSTETFDNDSAVADAQKDVSQEIEQNSVFKSKLLKSPSFSSSDDDNFDLDCMILNIVDETSPDKKELAVLSSESNINKVRSNLFESLSSFVQSSKPKSSVISDSEKNKSDFTITTELKPEVHSLISEIKDAESDCVTLSEPKLNVNNSVSKIGDTESDFIAPELKSNEDSSIDKNENTESDCTTLSELKPDVNISIDKEENTESSFSLPSEAKSNLNKLVKSNEDSSIDKNENTESDCTTLSELKPDVNISIDKEENTESSFSLPSEAKSNVNKLVKSNEDSSIDKNENTESDCTTLSELKPDVNISIDKEENTESSFSLPSEAKSNVNKLVKSNEDSSIDKNENTESDCTTLSKLKHDVNISIHKEENTESSFSLPSEAKSNVNKLVNKNDDIELDCITLSEPEVNNSINKNDIESGCVTLSQPIPDVNNLINENDDVEPDCITSSEQKCDLTKSSDKNENSESGVKLPSELKSNVNNLLNKKCDIESDCLTSSELKSDVNSSIHRNDDIESDCIAPSELKPDVNNSINENDFESGCVTPSELKLDINTSVNKSDDIESDCCTSSEIKPHLNNSTNKNESTESDSTNKTSEVSKSIQFSKANISDLDTSDKNNISEIDASNCKANISDFDDSHKALSDLDTSDEVNRSDSCVSHKESISESDSDILVKSNTVDLEDSNEIIEINYFKLNADKQTHNKLPEESETTEDVSKVLSNTPTKECLDRNKQVGFPKMIGGIEVDIIEGLIKRGVCVAEDDFHISDSSTTSSDIFTCDFAKRTKEQTKFDDILTKPQTAEKDSKHNCLGPDLLKDSKCTTVDGTTEMKHNSALPRDDHSEEIECIEIIDSKITSTAKVEKSVEVPDDVPTKVCKYPQLKEVDECAEIKTVETTIMCSESEMKPSDNCIEIPTAEADEVEIIHDSGSKKVNKRTAADKSETMGHLTSEDEKVSKKIKIEKNDELENLSDIKLEKNDELENLSDIKSEKKDELENLSDIKSEKKDELEHLSDIKSEKIDKAFEIQMKETDDPKNTIKCEPLEPNESPETPVLDHPIPTIEHCAVGKISISKEQRTAEYEKSELVLDPATKIVGQSQSIEIGKLIAENTSQGPTSSLEVRRKSGSSEAGSPLEKKDIDFVTEMSEESSKESKVLSDSASRERDESLEKQISESEKSETALSKPISEESDKTLEIKTLESSESDVIIDLSFEADEKVAEKPVFETVKSELVDIVSKGNNRDLSTEVHISKTGDSEAAIDSASEENGDSPKIQFVSESKESKVVLNHPSEENDKKLDIQHLLSIKSEPLLGEKDSKCDNNDSLEVEILEADSAASPPTFKKIKVEIHDEDKVNADVVNEEVDILDSTVKSAISELKAIVSQTNEHNSIDKEDILKLNAIKRKLDAVDNLAEIKKVKTEADKNEEKSSAVNDVKVSKGEKRKRKLEDDEEEMEERHKNFATEAECNKIADLSFMDIYQKHFKKCEAETFRFLAEIKEQSEKITKLTEKYKAQVISLRDTQAELFCKHSFKPQIPRKRTVGVNVKIYKEEDIQGYKEKPIKAEAHNNNVRIQEDISIETKMEVDIDTDTEFKTEPKTEFSLPGFKVGQKPLIPKFNLKDTIITPVATSPFPGKKTIVPRFITQTTRPILNPSLLSGRIPAPNVTVSGNRIISVGRPPVVLVPTNQLAASITNQCIDLTKEENKLKFTTAGVPMPTTVAKVATPGMPNTSNVLVPLRNCLQLLPSGSKAVNQQFNLPRQTLIPPFPSTILPGTRTVTYLVQQNPGLRARGIQPFIRPQNQQVQFLLRVTNPGSTPTVSPVVNTVARHVVPQRSISSTVNPSSGLVLISHTTKHPAPFPKSPHYPETAGKAIPPKPSLKGSKNASGIVLSWNMCLLRNHATISSYQLFAYQEADGPVDSSLWKKVGDVNALPLPMACTLTQFVDKNRYYFTVRAVDVHQRFGPFSDPVSILYEKESDSCTKK